jgi:Family of unknown function (DUF5320)
MKMGSINKMKVMNVMPNFDGTGPKGRGRRAGSGRGICRWSSEGSSGQASGRTGSRLSNLLWLAREVVSIWGAVKALREASAGPSLSVTEHDTFKRVNRPGLQKPAEQINQDDTLDMKTPPRLIEYRRTSGR